MNKIHECDEQPSTDYLVQRPFIECQIKEADYYTTRRWVLVDCNYDSGPESWEIRFCPWCGKEL